MSTLAEPLAAPATATGSRPEPTIYDFRPPPDPADWPWMIARHPQARPARPDTICRDTGMTY